MIPGGSPQIVRLIRGVHRVRITIDESIRVHDKLLLVLSADSIVSQWVESEVETALARERREHREVLFPVRIDSAVLDASSGWAALIRNTRYIGDFVRWQEPEHYDKAFRRLLQNLERASAL